MADIWRSEPLASEPDGFASETTAQTTVMSRPVTLASDLTSEQDYDGRRSAAKGYGDLAAIIRLQSTELERLAQENDRLINRLDNILELHQGEQRLRQDLQEQVLRLNDRAMAPTPVMNPDEIRREARDGMVQEIKPVLVAIMDLLERTLHRPGADRTMPEPQAFESRLPEPFMQTGEPVSVQGAHQPNHADDVAEVGQRWHLPAILTRPLEELTAHLDGSPVSVKDWPATKTADSNVERETKNEMDPLPSLAHARPQARERQSDPLPGLFAWTNFFA